jgi:dolichol-phosphate mannosyltransferase
MACGARPKTGTFPIPSDGAAGDGQSSAPAAGRPLISIVVPCYNEAEVFCILQERLRALADSLRIEQQCDTEFIFVDDGSRDSTWEQIGSLAEADDRFRGARLSRNFGRQAPR